MIVENNIQIEKSSLTSLENDPNMRLQQCGTDLMPSIEFGKQLFQSGDDGEKMIHDAMMINIWRR